MQRKQGSAVDSAPLFFPPFIHVPEIHPYTYTPYTHTPIHLKCPSHLKHQNNKYVK